MGEKRFIGVQQLAEYLDVAPKTIYKWRANGKIRCYKIGRKVKFDLQEIDSWINKCKEKVIS